MKEYIVSEDSYAYEMRRYDELKELIRCKDCRYFFPGENTTRGWCELSQHGCPNVDDYCSDAERKEE